MALFTDCNFTSPHHVPQALPCHVWFTLPYPHQYFLRIFSLPLSTLCSLFEGSANDIKNQQPITRVDSIMDLLRSLIVPPAYRNTSDDTPSRDPRLSYCTEAPSGQSSAEQSPLTPPSGPAAHQAAQQEASSTPAKGKKRKKKKQKQKQKQTQTPPEQDSVTIAAVLPTPATIPDVKQRKRFHLFHPDQPKSKATRRFRVNYEDHYDEVSNPPSIQATPNSHAANSNPEATQTCFFWYHGSCKRSNDRRGCQLRHALLDPPQMVVAPPRFVHPKRCELQWCAGDGPTHKGQKAKSGAEQKRYFDVAVSDAGSAREGANHDVGDDSCFLAGFEEPDKP